MNVEAGDRLPSKEVVALPEAMKTMALVLRDPNPIHWDVDAVRRLGLGDRPVNQGPNNMAYAVNLLLDWTGRTDCLRRIHVRFLAPVLAHDRVTVTGEVTAVREEDGERLADCTVWLETPEGRVLAADAVVALPRGDGRRGMTSSTMDRAMTDEGGTP